MKTKPAAHVYASDGIATPLGRDPWCLTCGLPKAHRSHDMPATPAAVQEQEARRMGEAE